MGIFLVGLLVACQSNDRFEHSFSQTGWAYADSLQYKHTNVDTTQLQVLRVRLTMNDNYPFRNFYIRYHIQTPSGQNVYSLLNYPLADERGHWLGEKKLFGGYDYDFAFNKPSTLPEKGAYQLTLVQFMRQDTLPGIEHIELAFEKAAQAK